MFEALSAMVVLGRWKKGECLLCGIETPSIKYMFCLHGRLAVEHYRRHLVRTHNNSVHIPTEVPECISEIREFQERMFNYRRQSAAKVGKQHLVSRHSCRQEEFHILNAVNEQVKLEFQDKA